MSYFEKPKNVVRTRSSDEESAWRDLHKMASMPEDVTGRPISVERTRREFYAGEFYQGQCRSMGRICLEETKATIDVLVTRDEARRAGLGTVVLKELEKVAMDRGISHIDMTNLTPDMVLFCEANGYTVTYLNFDGTVQLMSRLIGGENVVPQDAVPA